jgi:uncharacterized protein involved in exopolysaccharide biosynthesis
MDQGRFTRDQAPDFLSLRDMAAALREHRVLIVAFPLAVALLAATILSLAPRQWEARTTVLIQQFEDIGNYAEPAVAVQQRLLSDAFQNSVLKSVVQGLDAAGARKIRKSFRANAIPNSGLVEFALRGGSPEQAAAILRAAIAALRAEHELLIAPRVEQSRAQLAAKERERSGIEELLAIEPAVRGERAAGGDPVLLASTRYSLGLRSASLSQEIAALRRALEVAARLKTAPLGGEIDVSEEHVSPRIVLSTLAALVASAIAAVLFAFFRYSVRRA